VSDAAVARKSHSIMSAIRSGFTVWYALLGGIAAWAIHLVGVASLVRLTCNDRSWDWSLHALTAVTLAMTVVALWLCWRLQRTPADDDSLPDEPSLGRFLGRLGLLINTFNFALISLEEFYVIVLHSRPCG
jgi:hypothetical protein